jgi:hypothetical protein
VPDLVLKRVTLTEIPRFETPRARFRRAFVVCNESAGSVAKGDCERLVAILSEFGLDDIERVAAPFQKSAIRHARRSDLVVVLGGDGTARSVLAAAGAFGDPTLVLLPGGTLNMLPRALYGALEWEEALRAALTDGKVERLTGGTANGKAFFVAAMFGAPTLVARVREAVREGRLLRALRRLRLFMARAFARKLRARRRGDSWRPAHAIGVLGPSFSGNASERVLEWVRFEGRGLPDLVGLGMQAVADDWRRSGSVDVDVGDGGDIVSMGIIPAILDGEPRTFPGRVRIEMIKRGPRVLVLPRDAA